MDPSLGRIGSIGIGIKKKFLFLNGTVITPPNGLNLGSESFVSGAKRLQSPLGNTAASSRNLSQKILG